MNEKFGGSPNRSPEKKGLIDQKALDAFGNFLVQARFALPVGSGKLADIKKMVGLQETSSIQNWEEGNSLPNYESLGKIAVAYKIEGEQYRDFLKAYEISKEAREIKKKSGFKINSSSSGQSLNRFNNTLNRGRQTGSKSSGFKSD